MALPSNGNCGEIEQAQLLGYKDPATLQALKNALELTLPALVLERVSLIFGIYRVLGTLYPIAVLANEAIRHPRKDSPFEGVSPLAIMIQGDIQNLWETRRYFEAELQG